VSFFDFLEIFRKVTSTGITILTEHFPATTLLPGIQKIRVFNIIIRSVITRLQIAFLSSFNFALV